MSNKLEANFSALTMSIASSALMSLGLSPDPENNSHSRNLQIAHFNIELLKMLQSKTKNNLTAEEKHFLDSIINDLHLKYVKAMKEEER